MDYSHTSSATVTHKIQVSTDNVNWTDIKTGSGTTGAGEYMYNWSNSFTYSANASKTYYFRSVTSYSSGTFLGGAAFTVVGVEN